MLLRIYDDLKREYVSGSPPKRVVSLVPSETYNVAAIGAGGALVGRTDYCELPVPLVEKLPSVGGTKNPDVEAIIALDPDLVLANKEENRRQDLERLAEAKLRVFVSFPCTFQSGVAHLARLARIFRVEREPSVRALIAEGYAAAQSLAQSGGARPKVFCPIWLEPLMTINGATHVSSMIELVGAENAFRDRDRRYPLARDLDPAAERDAREPEERDTRYPRITMAEVAQRAPDAVWLPDEPYAFDEEHRALFQELDCPASRQGRIDLVSGKDLTWPGARAIEAVARLRELADKITPG